METGTWYQCRICNVICRDSKAVLSTHEKKHGRRSIQKLEVLRSSIPGISALWSEVKLETETEENDDGSQDQDDEFTLECGDGDGGEFPVRGNRPKKGHKRDSVKGSVIMESDGFDDDEGPPILSPYSPTPTVHSNPPPKPSGSRSRKGTNRQGQIAPTKTWKLKKLASKSRTQIKKLPPTSTRNSKRISSALSVSPLSPIPDESSKKTKKKLRDDHSAKSKRDDDPVGITITEGCRIIVNRSSSGNQSQSASQFERGVTVCNICGFIGRTFSDLHDHSRTHTKEKPFQCPACPARFSRTQNMRHHIRYNCAEAVKIGLAEKFKQKAEEYAKRVKARVPGSAESSLVHECSNCVEKFCSLVRLNHHSRVHTIGKNGAIYTCCFCQGDFYSERAATDHMARMHNTQMRSQFQCSHCSKYLSTSSSLKRHVYLSHFDKEHSDCLPVPKSTPVIGNANKQAPTSSMASTSVPLKKRKVALESGSTSSKNNSIGMNKQNCKISEEEEVVENGGSDVEWMDVPRIVKVEHVADPLPRNNSATLHSHWTKPHSSGRKTFKQNDMRNRMVPQPQRELEEPEMEIRVGGKEYFVGVDPLAF